MKTISEWLPWVAMVVMYIAGKVASFYDYSQKNDPEVANKLKHVGELAKWAVADQSRYSDKTGSVKFEDAVKSVEKQVKDVAPETIKGAVQNAYLNSDLPKSEPTPEPEPIEIPPAVQPVHDDSAILDDLEGK